MSVKQKPYRTSKRSTSVLGAFANPMGNRFDQNKCRKSVGAKLREIIGENYQDPYLEKLKREHTEYIDSTNN